MGLFDIFKKHEELEFLFDAELLESPGVSVYAKQIALQTCINLMANTISQTEFYFWDKKQKQYSPNSNEKEWTYRLNVRPNKNQTAHTFWKKVIHKLVYDGECLIIRSDTDDFLVADDYYRKKVALYGDRFTDVTIDDFVFGRSFAMEDVLFFEYGNEKIRRIIDGLYEDYGKLLKRLFSAQMRKNQIRSIVDIDANMAKGKEGQEKVNGFIDKAYNRILNNDVAIIPQQRGFEYNEKQPDDKRDSFDEIVKLTDNILDQVARALGIPPNFIKGENADTEKSMKQYLKFCIDPLLKLIQDELTATSISKSSYMAGRRIKAKRSIYTNIFEIAEKIDKLIGSGGFSRNEIREEAGRERVDDPKMDEFILTKNYTTESEGGENT